MLRALGDCDTVHTDRSTCCDYCNPSGVPYKSLVALSRKGRRKSQQSRSKKVRNLTEEEVDHIYRKLKEERDAIVSQSVSLRMLGAESVCNSHTMREICKRSQFIHTQSDLSKISSLRPSMHKTMFNVIKSTVNNVH